MLMLYAVNCNSPKTSDKSLLSPLDDLSITEDAGNDADDELAGEKDEDSKGEEEEGILHTGECNFRNPRSTTHSTSTV